MLFDVKAGDHFAKLAASKLSEPAVFEEHVTAVVPETNHFKYSAENLTHA